jgi:hypothetical protein
MFDLDDLLVQKSRGPIVSASITVLQDRRSHNAQESSPNSAP